MVLSLGKSIEKIPLLNLIKLAATTITKKRRMAYPWDLNIEIK